MTNKPDKPDEPNPNDAPPSIGHNDSPGEVIDRALAALRTAAPPEGMEARIAARLQYETAAPSLAALHSLAPSASWWRGAITGAAFATLIVAALLFLKRAPVSPSASAVASAPAAPAASAPRPTRLAVSADSHLHCASPAVQIIRPASPAFVPAQLLAATASESTAASRPAPVLPLTSQERQLVRLVRTSDPRQLAALGQVELARLEIEHPSDPPKDSQNATAAPSPDPNPAAAAAPASDVPPATAPESSTQASPAQPAEPDSAEKKPTSETVNPTPNPSTEGTK